MAADGHLGMTALSRVTLPCVCWAFLLIFGSGRSRLMGTDVTMQFTLVAYIGVKGMITSLTASVSQYCNTILLHLSIVINN